METCPMCLEDHWDGDECAMCRARRCKECGTIHRNRTIKGGSVSDWCRTCTGEAAAEDKARHRRDDRMTGDA